jgi:hypothetical protein
MREHCWEAERAADAEGVKAAKFGGSDEVESLVLSRHGRLFEIATDLHLACVQRPRRFPLRRQQDCGCGE